VKAFASLDLGWALKKRVFLAKPDAGRYQVPAFSGSCRTHAWFAAIAQLVEHVIRNDGVTGSSPVCGTDLSAIQNSLKRH
jgi:hypothetical protein